ncbi:6-phosphofructokinase isozyme 2 [mine drainage metagenome]|uniref:6-phosphofructokinase isozyme 2 n=1 Tax=mine drainage metagenome TaxID=410659 RepID=A0A1J5Q014_9ZZZZ
MSALPPIVTLTLNPSVDVTYEIETLVDDRKVHADAYRYDPGGNGVNVARALSRLQVPAHACFVAAGEVGQLLQRLLQRQVANAHALWVDGETRINVTLEQRTPGAQYEVIGVGPRLDADVLARMTQTVEGLAGGGYAVLTGSLPPGLPADTYTRLAAGLATRGARVVLDMQGDALRAVLASRPFLIKPNRYELEQLVGRALPTLDAVRDAACGVQAAGVEHVCVSLGADGALLAHPHGVWHGRAPRVAVRSTVGAGDSMLAGLVAALARGDDAGDALRLGLACGSGTAAQPGTELFDAAALPALLADAAVERG